MSLEYDKKLHLVLSAYYNLGVAAYERAVANVGCDLKDKPQCFCIEKKEAVSVGCAMICGINEGLTELKCDASYEPMNDECVFLSKEEEKQHYIYRDCYADPACKKIWLSQTIEVTFPNTYSCTLCQLYAVLALYLTQHELQRKKLTHDKRFLLLLGFLSVVNRVFAHKYYSALLSHMAALENKEKKRELANHICNLVKTIYECCEIAKKRVTREYLQAIIIECSKRKYCVAANETRVLVNHAFLEKSVCFLDLDSKKGRQSELKDSFECIKEIVQSSSNIPDDFLAWYEQTKGWVF